MTSFAHAWMKFKGEIIFATAQTFCVSNSQNRKRFLRQKKICDTQKKSICDRFFSLPHTLYLPSAKQNLVHYLLNYYYKIQRKYYQATTKARQRTKSQIPYALQVDELHRDE